MLKTTQRCVRILGCVLLGLWSVMVTHAQQKEGMYDFTSIPQSLLLNPGAEINFNSHYGVPFLSQFHANLGFKGSSVYDIFADDGRSFNAKVEQQLNQLTDRDYGTITQQLELLSFGWRSTRNPKLYFSGGLYQELDMIAYFPKDLLLLAYEGNQNFINKSFKLSDISATAELLTVYHFGYTKQLNKKLTFGARAKLYSSIFNSRSTRNSGRLTTIDTPNGNNFYTHIASNIDFSVKTSGIASLEEDLSNEEDASSTITSTIFKRALLGGNLGVGVDVGFSYRIKEQWVATGSMTDFGLIAYTKDVQNYTASGSYAYEGFETPEALTGRSARDFLDELEEALDVDTTQTAYTAMRPVKLQGSLKYMFNRDDNGSCNCVLDGNYTLYSDAVGIQVFSQFRPKRSQRAISLFYQKRISNFLSAKINYTINDFSATNIGILLSAYFYKINFYLSTNNILSYGNLAKTRELAVQFGFNIIP